MTPETADRIAHRLVRVGWRRRREIVEEYQDLMQQDGIEVLVQRGRVELRRRRFESGQGQQITLLPDRVIRVEALERHADLWFTTGMLLGDVRDALFKFMQGEIS